MTLNMSQLRERIATKFPDVEQMGDSILRFTKKRNNSPYAVYYIDITQDLPRSQKELIKYQDKVIGSYYFEGRKSLQWNNYLYFVTKVDRLSTREGRKIKELIEGERSYARKFVITEEVLDSVITPPVVSPADSTPPMSILSIWTQKLIKAGLDRAILSDDDLPTRLALIESSHMELNARQRRRLKRTVGIETIPFIHSFQLKKYRDLPEQRDFTFGTVNLIFGANGSGKTSLLEAIELFLCGRTRRNPDARTQYELAVVFDDGRSEIVREDRGLNVFRNRNLMWYGQSEIKTNNLYQSFAQFNFLDTDAAVRLVESPSRIVEDLSKLLVGPDVSKTWRDIVRVFKAVTEKLHDLRKHETWIKNQLASLEGLIKAASDVRQTSDLICSRLNEMIHRVGWRGIQGKKETFGENLVRQLFELVSVAQQATALDWPESPVSIEGLTKYCLDTRSIIDNAKASIANLELHRKHEKSLEGTIHLGREALDLAKRARRMIQTGLPDLLAERNKQEKVKDACLGRLAGLDEDALCVLTTSYLDKEVGTCHEVASSKRTSVENLLTRTRREYEEFSKVRDQSINLAQELRQIAERILSNSHHPDECPLCHTQFEPGELKKQINLDVNERLETSGQTLLARLHSQEIEIRDAIAIEIALGWLIQFCERSSIAKNVLVRSALAEVEKVKKKLSEADARINALDREVLALESQGISMVVLEDVLGQLRNLGYRLLPEFSRDAADRLILAFTEELSNSYNTLENEGNTIRELRQSLGVVLGFSGFNDQEPNIILSQLKERITTTESIRAKLKVFSSLFPWPEKRPLAELVVEAELIRKVAVELQMALGEEKQAKTTYTKLIDEKEPLDKELASVQARVKRLSEAQSSLEGLQRENSFDGAMDSALQQNRCSIETIFSRIHSPAEFCGLGLSWTTLVREMDGSEAKLSEISSGQRAAFALSIFLAQNAQLISAPPIILIDDPIAHVDDLNSLSFLDYLREVVLRGRRQIFFATANEKIASLFERKFDFLGSEEFRRFNLRRAAYSTRPEN